MNDVAAVFAIAPEIVEALLRHDSTGGHSRRLHQTRLWQIQTSTGRACGRRTAKIIPRWRGHRIAPLELSGSLEHDVGATD